MAIEIRELVIKATITDTKPQQQHARLDKKDIERLRQEIIRECISTVMGKIEERTER